MALRGAHRRVVNLACSLGRKEDRKRRLRELEEARVRADFELELHNPPLKISADDNLDRAQTTLAGTLVELIPRERVSLVVSPSPHDGHHGHEVVGRATRDALRALGENSPRWWMWGLWSDLPLPTVMSEFDSKRLTAVLHALSAYTGELSRNDYRVLVEARGKLNRVLGPERVFGYGAEGSEAEFVELLTEAFVVDGSWRLGAPRRLDPSDPFPSAEPGKEIDWWLDALSVSGFVRAGRGSP
jgi:LmbE family N-acetylglucosaminyl deacetylase